MNDTNELGSIKLRNPLSTDGHAVHQLIANCSPLDTNSMYCNLLQCTHFSRTSVVAEANGQMVGFVSGYLLPDAPNTLFVWQVAVAKAARGQGVASKMLNHLINSDAGISYLHTTITQGNQASWATFERLAKQHNAPLSQRAFFSKDTHFNQRHDTEYLVEIGPFPLSTLSH
ncbi:MAG: diaminobutyrate acetyltransferase [Venatoribacter sp.]